MTSSPRIATQYLVVARTTADFINALLWRHLLAHNDAGEPQMPSLFAFAADPVAVRSSFLRFVPLDPVTMERSVPEDAWVNTDPNTTRMKAVPEDGSGKLGVLL